MFTPEYTLMLLIFTKLSSQCASKEFVLLVLVHLSPDLDSSIQKCMLYRHGNAQVQEKLRLSMTLVLINIPVLV